MIGLPTPLVPETDQPVLPVEPTSSDGQNPSLPALPALPAIQEPEQEPDDPQTAALRRMESRDRDAFAKSMRLAVKQQPDLYAEAERLAKASGVPVETALNNMDELRELARFRQARDTVVESTNPTLFRSIRNFEFQKKAQDDLANLAWGERVTKNYRKGQWLVERGTVASRIRDGVAQPGDSERLEWIDGFLESGGDSAGLVGWVAETVGQMSMTLPKMAEGGIKGAMAGGSLAVLAGQAGPQALAPEELVTVPAAMLSGFIAGAGSQAFVSSYVIEGGNAYRDMIRSGFDEERARWASRGVGLVNAALEVGGTAIVARPFVQAAKRRLGMEVAGIMAKPGALPPFLGEYLRQVGAETGQELAQEISGLVGEWAAAQTGQGPTWGEAWDRIVEVAVKTAGSQAVLGVLGSVIHARSMAAKARRAQEVRGYVESMSGVSVDSKLRARDPASFEEHHRKLVEDNPDAPSHFYVDGAQFAEILRQSDKADVEAGAPLQKSAADQLDGVVPGIASEIENAERTGGDVVIPAEVYLSRIATRPELNNALAPLLRDAPDGVPLGDADRVLEESDATLAQEQADQAIFDAIDKARMAGGDVKAALESAGVQGEQKQGQYLKAAAKRDAERKFEESRQAVEGTIYEEMGKASDAVGTTKVSARERAGAARFTAETVASLAQRAKVSPEEFWQQHKLAFGEGEAVLNQPGRGGYRPADMRFLFTKETDASTLFHELGHWYVDVVRRVSALEGSSEAIRADWDTLLKRWGVADMAAWDALDSKAQAKHLEDFTYNLEDYLATGDAPTPAMQGLFDRIRTWIVRIYRNVRDRLNKSYKDEFGVDLPALTPELRDVFDRMVASQDAIDATRAARDLSSLFLDEKAAKAAGIDEATRARLLAADEEAVAAAASELTQKGMRGIRSMERARSKAIRDQQNKVAEARAKIREQVEPEVRGRPEFLAAAQIRYGTVVDNEGREVSAKLDTDAVRAVLGDDAELAAYEAQRDAARAAAMEAAGKDAERIAEGQAPAVAAEVARNRAALEKERAAFEKQATEQAKEKVGAEPVYRAISFIENGTIDDNGVSKPARLDRGAVRLLAGKTKLGAASEVFDRIPAKLLRKGGASPDIVAAMFQFPNATTLVEAIAEADFDRDVAAEVARLKKESGLFDKALDKAAVVTAAGGDPTAVALASFRAGERAAREVAKVSRPALVSDLLENYTRKNGQSPDMTADQFGFSTGEEMLRAIIAAGDVDEAIAARTEERLAAEFGELLDEKAQRRAVEEALHSTARARVIAGELKALLRSSRPTSEMMAAAKEAARQLLLRTPVGQISPRLYSANEARAAKAARDALEEGDVAAAVEAQRKYLLQHYLTRQSLDIEQEVDRFVGRTVSRVWGNDEKLAKSHDFDIVQAARAVLARHGFGTMEQAAKPESYLDNVKQYDEELWAELDQEIRQATFDAKAWQSMPLSEFRLMADAVTHLMDRARQTQTIEIDGKRMAKAQAVAQLIQAGEAGPLGKARGSKAIARETIAAGMARGKAWLTQFEHWARWADGGKVGPFTRYLYRPLANAAVQKRLEASKLKEQFAEIIKSMGPLSTERIDATKWLGDGVFFDGVAELLGAVLHTGNDSNKQKLIGGYLWGGQDNEGRFSTAGWDDFFAEMQRRGADGKVGITKPMMDGIQAIWDLNDKTLKPAAQRVNREVANRYFDEIQAMPVQTMWGSYRGGYIPATPDPKNPSNGDLATRPGLEAIQDGEQRFTGSVSGVNNNFTRTRTGAFRPLTIDLRLAVSHIDDALQFIHMQKPVRTVARLLRDQQFGAYLRATQPEAMRDILLPMMERVALDRITKPVAGAWLANWLRRSATVGFLAGSMRNILQQFTGLVNATHFAPTGDLMRSAWALTWPGRGRLVKQILGSSDFMRDLVTNQAEQIMDGIERQLDPGFWKDAQRKVGQVALLPQAWTQNRVNMIVWHAKYNETVRTLGSEIGGEQAHAEAVQRADAAVRLSQGSRTPLDIANAFGQNAWARLMTQFGDYANVTLQPILLAQNQRERVVALLKVLIVPSIASSAIALALSGGRELEDSDEDGDYVDEWARFWLGGVVRTGLGMVPVAGSAAGSVVFGRTRRADDRLSPFPAWTTVKAAADLYGNLVEEWRGGSNVTRDVALLMSAMTGIPFTVLGRAAGFAQDEAAGKAEANNPFSYVLGLINGR